MSATSSGDRPNDSSTEVTTYPAASSVSRVFLAAGEWRKTNHQGTKNTKKKTSLFFFLVFLVPWWRVAGADYVTISGGQAGPPSYLTNP